MTDTVSPYASPRTDCRGVRTTQKPCVDRMMLGVIRLYRWMGIVGGIIYSGAAIAAVVGWAVNGFPLTAQFVVPFVSCMSAVAPFGFSIHVARRLETNPQGLLFRARLVGIVLATAWFPILTSQTTPRAAA